MRLQLEFFAILLTLLLLLQVIIYFSSTSWSQRSRCCLVQWSVKRSDVLNLGVVMIWTLDLIISVWWNQIETLLRKQLSKRFVVVTLPLFSCSSSDPFNCRNIWGPCRFSQGQRWLRLSLLYRVIYLNCSTSSLSCGSWH